VKLCIIVGACSYRQVGEQLHSVQPPRTKCPAFAKLSVGGWLFGRYLLRAGMRAY